MNARKPWEELTPPEQLFLSAETTDKLKHLTNAELARLLLEHVWAEMDILSPQSDLLSEVIDRLDPTMRGDK